LKHEGINRRKFARIYTELDARFVVVCDDINRFLTSKTSQAKTKSISVNGVCLRTNKVQVDGLHICSSISGITKNKLKLEIDLPYKLKTINIIGEVSWYDMTPENDEYLYNVGVSFTKISDEDKKALKLLISKVKKRKKIYLNIFRK